MRNKKAFVIGLNRSFLYSASDILLFKDAATLKDMTKVVNNKEEPGNSRVRNTRLIKIGMGLPLWKDVSHSSDTGTVRVRELTETNINSKNNQSFIKAIGRRVRGCKDKINIDLDSYEYNPSCKDGDSMPTMMMVSVCNGAMHLTSRLFKSHKVPIFLVTTIGRTSIQMTAMNGIKQ